MCFYLFASCTCICICACRIASMKLFRYTALLGHRASVRYPGNRHAKKKKTLRHWPVILAALLRTTSSYQYGWSRIDRLPYTRQTSVGATRKNSLEIACQGKTLVLPNSAIAHFSSPRDQDEGRNKKCCSVSVRVPLALLSPPKTLLISRDWLSGPDSSRETSGSRG